MKKMDGRSWTNSGSGRSQLKLSIDDILRNGNPLRGGRRDSDNRPAAQMTRIRQLHLYLGTLFAPSIIFFAFTGALQTFGLHEASKSSGEPPRRWIATLAEVHKNQRLSKPQTTGSALQEKDSNLNLGPKQTEQPHRAVLALKCFVLLMAVGLITAAVLGIYMSFKYNRDKRVVYGLLLIGVALPFALLLF
jgi:hypothetical protein